MGKTGPSWWSSKAVGFNSTPSSGLPLTSKDRKMIASAPLDHAWSYPLFEALYRRRSRRFGLGFEMQEGPFRYKSAHAPIPLTELEEALLVGAGAGFTGLAFWDLPTPAPYPRQSGRTFSTTRAGGHTALFWTNDKGLYVLDDKVAASKLREVET